MIINRRKLVDAKMERLRSGYSAFAESKEVVTLLEEEIIREQLPVIIEKTELGCWFIPEKERSFSRQVRHE